MDYAIIGYPLSDRFRSQVEQLIGTVPCYLGLPDLRRLPFRKLAKQLATTKADRLFIPLEGQSSIALLPIFYCLAGLIRARKIELIHPNLQCETISRWRAVRSIAGVIAASCDGQLKMRRCKSEVAKLLAATRVDVTFPTSGSVLYLKSNLWIGVKAGGSVGHVAGVANALMKEGCAIDFVGVEPPLGVDGAAHFHPVPPPKNFGVPSEINLYRYQNKIDRSLENEIGKLPRRFIYQRLSISNYSGVLLSRHHKIPLVLEYNGSETWASRQWGTAPRNLQIAQQCEDVCLRHAHLMVTVSKVLRDELIERGVEANRIVCYPNCIDPATFDPARFSSEHRSQLRKQWGIGDDAIVAGFVGTFGQWHGVEVLARAVRQFVMERTDWLRRSKLQFLIVGDGLGMSAVSKILDDERCKPFYTLTGLVPQKDAPAYMAISDLLLSPHVENADGSRFFGSPTKLFEYMAMGKAIVASDLEQIGELLSPSLDVGTLSSTTGIVAHGGPLSILCRPGDVASLMRGIEVLVGDAELRSALGKRAREEALSKYTWQRHVRAILDQFATL